MADLQKLQKIKEAMGMTTPETKTVATKPVKKVATTTPTKETPKEAPKESIKTVAATNATTANTATSTIIKRRVWPD